MKPSSLIAARVVLRAACALGVAAATAVVSLDCGGKIGGTAPDGGPASGSSGSSGGSSGGVGGSSSGIVSSSGSSGSSTVCNPMPGCQSTTYCPTTCGGCSCSGGEWVCSEDPNCIVDASPPPPPACPPTPPGPGPCAPAGETCTYPAMPGCVASCTCDNLAWAPCIVTCSTPPPPTCLDAGLYGLDVPDSGIGNTGATLAGCYSCLENTCPAQFKSCSVDCTCQTGVLDFLSCVAAGTPPLSCGMTLQSTGGPAGTALLQCAAAPLLGGPGPGCLSQCGVAGAGIADASVTD